MANGLTSTLTENKKAGKLKNRRLVLLSDGIKFKKSFKTNPKTANFILKNFPEISEEDWNNWHWQSANSISSVSALKKIISLTADEEQALNVKNKCLPFKITPYYASLFSGDNNNNPLRKCVIPRMAELTIGFGEEPDPLHEDNDSPVPGIIHRYPDRVLFLVTPICSNYCRYCTRSRAVGENHVNLSEDWERGIEYIKNNKKIRDVLLSGGDPLTLPDDKLEYLLQKIREIKHVEIVRLGTKIPTALPQRITPELVNILKRYHPLFISIHFTHPDELTNEVKIACERLADAGIPLGSQTVLLRGVNNEAKTMTKLMQGLLKIRVRPYYLYQCDPIQGSSHFRTSIKEGLDIIKGLRGFTSGYAVPHYVIDAPGGGGKIPILPEYYQGEDEDYAYFKNYEEKQFKYPKTK